MATDQPHMPGLDDADARVDASAPWAQRLEPGMPVMRNHASLTADGDDDMHGYRYRDEPKEQTPSGGNPTVAPSTAGPHLNVTMVGPFPVRIYWTW